MGSSLEPDVRNEAQRRDPAPVPLGGEGATPARLEAALHARRRARADHRVVPGAPRARRMSGITSCRSCRAAGLETILSLGAMPLANALLRAEQLATARSALSARPRLLPCLQPGADHRDGSARGAVPRLPLLLVVLRRRWSRTRASWSDGWCASARSARRASSSRSRATTATCCSTTRRRRCRCSGSSRRATSPRWPSASAASRRSPSSSTSSWRSGSPPRAGAPTCCTPTTCSPTSRT